MTKPLVVRWTPQQSDLANAYEARRYPLGFRRREFKFAGVAGVVCVLGLATRSSDLSAAALTLGLLGLVILIPGTARRFSRPFVGSIWKANPLLALPVEATLSTDGLQYDNGSNDTHYQWSAFSGWIESETGWVLCLSHLKQAFISIPMRAAGDLGAGSVNSVLTENLGPAITSGRSSRGLWRQHEPSTSGSGDQEAQATGPTFAQGG